MARAVLAVEVGTPSVGVGTRIALDWLAEVLEVSPAAMPDELVVRPLDQRLRDELLPRIRTAVGPP